MVSQKNRRGDVRNCATCCATSREDEGPRGVTRLPFPPPSPPPPPPPPPPTPTATCSLLWSHFLRNESARSKRAAEWLLSHSIYPPRGEEGRAGGVRRGFICVASQNICDSLSSFHLVFHFPCSNAAGVANKVLLVRTSWGRQVIHCQSVRYRFILVSNFQKSQHRAMQML